MPESGLRSVAGRTVPRLGVPKDRLCEAGLVSCAARPRWKPGRDIAVALAVAKPRGLGNQKGEPQRSAGSPAKGNTATCRGDQSVVVPTHSKAEERSDEQFNNYLRDSG